MEKTKKRRTYLTPLINCIVTKRSIVFINASQKVKRTHLCLPLSIIVSCRSMYKFGKAVVGHVPKLLNALEQQAAKTAEVVVNAPSIKAVTKDPVVIHIPENISQDSQKYVDTKIKENIQDTNLVQASSDIKNSVKYHLLKNMVLDPDENRLVHHAKCDYSLDKIITRYQEHNAKIVCLIQDPIPLAGVFTMSKDKFDKINQGSNGALDAIVYQIMDYSFHIYKDPITNESDVTSRINNLFTYDPLHRIKFPKGCVHGYESNFPIRQHLLTVDMHNLVLKVTNLRISPQITITQEYLTVTKYLELCILQKTHRFLLSGNIEVILVNEKDKTHTTLCQMNANKFSEIMGQVNPDFIGKVPVPSLIAIPGKESNVIPIDIKLHSLPEQSIAFYNSYSTLSPCLQTEVFVHRSKVCAEAHINKMKKQQIYETIRPNLDNYLNTLKDTSKLVQNKKITSDQGYNIINTLNQSIICQPHQYNLYPTFIETAIIDNTFNLSWENNKMLYEVVFQDIRKMIQQDITIIFQNSHKYNSYTFDLLMQRVLHKMQLLGPGYLENYNNLRKVLQITYE